MQNNQIHKFHIPVMGLAFTIDSPIKVAQYGISSVMSVVETRLIEMMRKHYYPTIGREYEPISENEEDYIAKRVTDYLNLVNTIVQNQINKIKAAAFEKGSEIVKYFEMLPDDSTLKQLYNQMMQMSEGSEKSKAEEYLRTQVKAGSIDINIMTKLDKENFNATNELIEDGSDAVSVLRGYSKSDLKHSAVVFSAGMNPRLYNYLGKCDEFSVNEDGTLGKKVIVKVSDYRSALIQGKYLAKKGIWVSEFRIESGLNCGGHAFATDGYLLGPILQEFKDKKQELIDSLFEIYNTTYEKKYNKKLSQPQSTSITVQGGIGTYEELENLCKNYNIDSTGWGTPFLLVPEATTVDEPTLEKLCLATEKDVELSYNSPLGVRFHYLKGTSSDKEKLKRIKNNNPGSPCTEKHLSFNTEFTAEPICTASKKYQKLKIKQLQNLELPKNEFNRQLKEVLDKECLCIGLSNSAAINYSQTLVNKLNSVTICPGPNIVNFSKVISLKKMVDHIYGRNELELKKDRPHMFIAELYLYIDFLKEKVITDLVKGEFNKLKKYYALFIENLNNGITYYKNLKNLQPITHQKMLKELERAEIEINSLIYKFDVYTL